MSIVDHNKFYNKQIKQRTYKKNLLIVNTDG